MPGPLDCVRVVEIAAGGGLSLAGMLLADMGAEVIRVERAGRSRRELGPDTALRGRQSIIVNLRTPAGPAVVIRLAQSAAVLIEGFRPGVAESMGIGPDACCAANPELVYGRLSGWGQRGPEAGKAGHDLNFLAAAGVLDGPALAATGTRRPLTTIADRAAPALLFAFGVVCAIFEVGRSGRGQIVDCAAVDAALVAAAKFGATGDPATTPPSHLGAPYYGVYATADGQHVAVAAIEGPRYRTMLDRLGLAGEALDAAQDPARWPAVRAAVAAAFASRDAAHWATVFADADAGVTPVRRPGETDVDPQLRGRGSFTEVAGCREPEPRPLLSRTPGGLTAPRSVPGQQSRQVLAGAGYAAEEIDALLAAGVVRAASE
jgi:alpha-methylacyl-CoA racemase